MAVSTLNTVQTVIFPTAAVEACLSKEINRIVKQLTRVRGSEIGIDSLAVVEILCKLDDILPFEVNESVVRPGGYSSVEDAVTDVSRRIEKQWRKYTKE
jgi:acyl carrier protein